LILFRESCLPSKIISPLSGAVIPANDIANSVLPEPIRPVMPTISPSFTEKYQ
jgi:hypothetical protein